MQLGVAVLVIPYRHPLTTAKMLATADQLSGGRVVLGAGVGWLREEFEALGLPAQTYERRGAVSVEYLEVMQRAWTAEEPISHEGEFVSFGPVGTRPRPARPIPVWIGGKGEAPLRRAVRLGEGHLAISSDPGALRREVGRLHELAQTAGRDPSELTVGLIEGIVVHERPLGPDRSLLHGTPDQILSGLAAYAEAGLDHLVAGVRSAGDGTLAGSVAAMSELAEHVLAELAPIGTPGG